MKDVFRKTLLAAVGMVVLTREKLEEVVKEMVSKGEISEEEGKAFVREIGDKLSSESKEIGDRLGQEFSRLLEGVGLVRKSDLETLTSRLEELEAELSRLRAKEDEGDEERE